ncbi:MAG: potassium-transporting ATPase subunit KdpA, partial [Alphaproteobacteria bacterium]|nr:potassium-transporting ATPase subunit KdpA [Alphaproteobacteria bacterium]
MMAMGWVQIALYCAVLLAITAPLGAYMTAVFEGKRTFLSFALRPLERAIYWVCGVDEKDEQHWTTYGVAMLAFSVAGFMLFYLIQRLQGVLPLNPAHLPAVGEHLAFNTAISFVTNTNWQSYVPETTMSYLTEMTAMTMHNFVSAAAGIALALALIRGFARRSAKTVG